MKRGRKGLGRESKGTRDITGERQQTIADVIRIRQHKAILGIERFNFIVKLLIIALIIFILLTTVFGITTVKGVDMYPAMKDGDIAIYFRLGREYAGSDVLVYKHDGETHIGRVVGTTGTEFGKTDEGLLLIDGRIHPIQERNGLYYDTTARDMLDYPLTLGDGEFFLLGDQRERAEDSRDYGPINKKEIKGKVFTILRKRGI